MSTSDTLGLLNEVARFVQATNGRYFFPVHITERVGCTWTEAYLSLMILREWKKVGCRKDGRWFLVI